MSIVSVIIPLYNAEKYIQTAVESVLGQTFQNFELIIIDDCSTDNSLEVVQKFNDPRIKIYRQLKNSGESSSRNLGLINSSGKYVYFMDHDDALLPDCLEIFYKAAEESNADVVHMNSFLVVLNDDFKHSSNEDVQKCSITETNSGFLNDNVEYRLMDTFLQNKVYITPWIKFSRRDFLIDSQLYFPPTKLMADVLHLIGELCFAKKIYTIDAIGYVWRRHENQTTSESVETHIKKALESIPVAIDFLHKIFASTKLISPISKSVQSQIEFVIVKFFLMLYVTPAYKINLEPEKFDEVINQVFKEEIDLNFFRDLIKILAGELLSIAK